MKINLAILLITFCLFSCHQKEEQKATPILPQKKITFAVPDSISSQSIFVGMDDTGFTRVWVKSKDNNNRYFYSDTLNVLKITRYQWDENKKFRISKELVLEKAEWAYLEVDSSRIKTEKINNTPYLFLTTKVEFMGNAITEQAVIFRMINTQNFSEQYDLTYSGMYSEYCENCIRGEFIKNKKLDKNQSFKDKLYAYAKTSTYIYQPSKEEDNVSYYKNFDKKWEKDNKADNHFGAGTALIPDKIKSTYYKENLFDLTLGSTDIIENENYKIQSVFRGNLIGYNKSKMMYFPILIESCTLSCNKTITFINAESIGITYEDGSNSILNLSNISF